jgi:hypothetical protein
LGSILENVKPEYVFITKDGQKIRSISQLQKSLVKMSDDVFDHHTKQGRNDFSNWIRDIYKDKALAETAVRCKSKKELADRLKGKLIETVKNNRKSARPVIAAAKIMAAEKKPVQKEQASTLRKADVKKPMQKEQISAARKAEEKKPQIKQEQPKVQEPEIIADEQVFVNRPMRMFTTEERMADSAAKPKITIFDFFFGIVIGAIALLILKQLFGGG